MSTAFALKKIRNYLHSLNCPKQERSLTTQLRGFRLSPNIYTFKYKYLNRKNANEISLLVADWR